MKKQNNEQNWVRVETQDSALGLPLELADKLQEEKRPVQRSEEQKQRVVSRLMSRLWEDT